MEPALRIILLDDDEAVARAYAEDARAERVDLEAVADETTLRLRMSRPHDLVVVDVSQHALARAELVRELAAARAPLVVISADPWAAASALYDPIAPVLGKPVAFTTLVGHAARARDGRPSLPLLRETPGRPLPIVAAWPKLEAWRRELRDAEALFVRGDAAAAREILSHIENEAANERKRHALGTKERDVCTQILAKVHHAHERFRMGG